MHECNSHQLTVEDFRAEPDEDRSSDSEEVTIKFKTWKKDESGYTVKVDVRVDLDGALDMWQEHVRKLKEHIHVKRVNRRKFFA